jgi:hypothetical protein
LAEVQLVPLSVERNTPPPLVPAKRPVPEARSDWTIVFVRPLFTGVQLAPSFVERNMPPLVPAKRFDSKRESAVT